MYTYTDVTEFSTQRLLVLGLILLGIVLVGCTPYCWVEFGPLESERPVVFFGRYLVEMRGGADAGPVMSVDISYAETITDTNNVDTIPIFVIDSICFVGQCLDSSFCAFIESQWDYSLRSQRESPDTFLGYLYNMTPLRPWDLWYTKQGTVDPGWFNVFSVEKVPFPEACTDTAVSVRIRARLLDRKTGETIATEAKMVRFRLKLRKEWFYMSQTGSEDPLNVGCCTYAIDGDEHSLDLLPDSLVGLSGRAWDESEEAIPCVPAVELRITGQ